MHRSLLRSRSRLLLTAALALTLALVACDDGDPSADGDTTTDTSDTGDSDVPATLEGLVINEISAGSAADWLELYNGSSAAIDLATLALTDDLEDDSRTSRFVDGSGELQPGGYAQIFLSRDGWPGWQLGDAESVWLLAPDGTPLDSATWTEGQSPDGASFGRIPDATGDFLTLLTPTPGATNLANDGGATCGDGTLEGSEGCDDANQLDRDGCSPLCQVEPDWTCSGEPSACATNCGDGIRTNPEQCDPAIVGASLACSATCTLVVDGAAATPVRINEVVWRDASVDAPDWIELVNTGETAVDLAGWRLADEDFDENFTPLPGGLSIAAGEHLVFERDHASDPDLAFGFGLDSNDAVLLIDATGALVDVADWREGDVEEGASFARSPDGSGAFAAQGTPTKGAANP